MTLNDVTIAGNSAEADEEGYFGDGGAICVSDGSGFPADDGKDLTLNGETHIIYNRADNAGGGLNVDANNVTIKTGSLVTIEHNQAMDGGGVF